MKRLGIVLASAFVASVFAGCGGGGIEPGIDKDAATTSAQPSGFQELMQKNSKNMALKKGGRPKAAPASK